MQRALSMLKVVFFVVLFRAVLSQVVYDAYFGKPISQRRNETLTALNAIRPCTISVRPCVEYEGRRVDGTCVNPRYPSRGGAPSPMLRMTAARFGLGNRIRPALNGSALPSARLLRTTILSDGYPESHQFSTLGTYLFVFSSIDSIDLTYLLKYIIVSDCCVGNVPNTINPQCIPIPVPEDDTYLRIPGVRCMNLTRFNTFQDFGCLSDTLPAERYDTQTPLLDLSVIYGNNEERLRQIRTNQGGLLISENRGGVETPPRNSLVCINNRLPEETVCYEFGESGSANAHTGTILSALWFFREHNRLAREIASVNPCWDDQKIFDTARQIHIAEWQYLFYYELMVEILGKQYALHAGIIYETKGYVNDFDERFEPGVYQEYMVGTRWFHNMQDGRPALYSNQGVYLGSRYAVEDEIRSGYLEINNTEAGLTQGAFRQRAAKLDFTMDPELAERVFGGRQLAADLGAIDMMRGRDTGLGSYNEYRRLCGMPVGKQFSDFQDAIHIDKLERLSRIYDHVDDLELMAAIYAEKLLPGSWVGPTLFCVMAHNLVQWRKSDRHFFEHGDTPTALTLPQLNEVRKTSFARLLCDNGDQVIGIQPRALLNSGPSNEITNCNNIPGIDINKWRDEKCAVREDDYKTHRSLNFNPFIYNSHENKHEKTNERVSKTHMPVAAKKNKKTNVHTDDVYLYNL